MRNGINIFYHFQLLFYILAFENLINAELFSNTSLATNVKPCLNKLLKKIAMEHSLYLTDLHGGATQQFRKAWDQKALRSVAWDDLQRDVKPI